MCLTRFYRPSKIKTSGEPADDTFQNSWNVSCSPFLHPHTWQTCTKSPAVLRQAHPLPSSLFLFKHTASSFSSFPFYSSFLLPDFSSLPLNRTKQIKGEGETQKDWVWERDSRNHGVRDRKVRFMEWVGADDTGGAKERFSVFFSVPKQGGTRFWVSKILKLWFLFWLIWVWIEVVQGD